MKKYSSSPAAEKGFTLIEMVVAIALFIVVALVAVGALLKVLDANKKSQSLKTTINNINFAMDAMTREMRVGANYYCISGNNPSSVPEKITAARECDRTSGPWIVSFNSSKTAPEADGTRCNLIYSYWFDGKSLNKWEQTACGEIANSNSYAPIIFGVPGFESSDDIYIEFESVPIKVVAGPGIQSYVQVRFTGHAGERKRTRSAFDFQTTISQRLAD